MGIPEDLASAPERSMAGGNLAKAGARGKTAVLARPKPKNRAYPTRRSPFRGSSEGTGGEFRPTWGAGAEKVTSGKLMSPSMSPFLGGGGARKPLYLSILY